jgi:LPPG:FO 2-phospho-L-lactate transferase
VSVARHYAGLLDGFVLDAVDRDLVPQVEALGMAARAMPTMMVSAETRIAVARDVLRFAASLLATSG